VPSAPVLLALIAPAAAGASVAATLLLSTWHAHAVRPLPAFWVSTLAAALAAAVCEELLMRRLLLRSLSRRVPFLPANACVSCVGATALVIASLALFVSHWAFSMWMGFAYRRRWRLRQCIWAHAVVDWAWFLLVGLAMPTGEPTPSFIAIEENGGAHWAVALIHLAAMLAAWAIVRRTLEDQPACTDSAAA